MKKTAVLGISAYFHDSAAALIVDGKIVAAAQEERFSRIKQDKKFPTEAIRYTLEESGITFEELDAIVFYDKPFLKFERLLETYHAFAPKGLRSFIKAIPVWIKEKLFMRSMIRKELSFFGVTKAPLLFSEHHLSHASSAFYPSPFKDAAILTVDGIGEWATTTIGIGNSDGIRILKELHFPHSVGLLYSAFTYFLGFRVNSGEYKLMGLAPYGEENEETETYKNKIIDQLVDIREDGSILLNMDYFNFATGLTMIQARKWEKLFGFPRREPESEIKKEHMNLAFAIQQITETILIRLAQTARQITGCQNLVMAGGVALNCVANRKLESTGLFQNLWIQPASGDAGGALGAALAGYHIYLEHPRYLSEGKDMMKNAYLGPSYSDHEIGCFLSKQAAHTTYYNDFQQLTKTASLLLAEGAIIGWFQGRMEFGPRALGNRSILGDPRNPDIQKTLNLKIKFREGFRPFAPCVIEEDALLFFDRAKPSPYMLSVTQIKKQHQFPVTFSQDDDLYKRLYQPRSILPAITHMDYSARLQTVNKVSNPRLYQLLEDFKEETGIGVLVNTSFNVRGEPIVCSPQEAFEDFMYSNMDYLVMGNFLLAKKDQPQSENKRERKIKPD